MFKNQIKIAWRHVTRNKGYTLINVSGLAIGMAAFLLIFLIVRFELSYDKFQANYKSIYHVVTQNNRSDGTTYNSGVAAPTGDALRVDFPQFKSATLEANYGGQITVPGGNGSADKKFTENTGFVFIEPEFFGIFNSKWLSGQPSVLSEPNTVVIDKSTANKYFGTYTGVVGRILKMDNLVPLKVAGIIEDAPSNTDFPFKIMVSYLTLKQHAAAYNFPGNNWHFANSGHEVFMLLPPGVQFAGINQQIINFSKKHFDGKGIAKSFQFLQPLSIMHFDTRFGNTLGDHISSMATLKTLAFIGLLTVIMAAINFVNLSTAQSVTRSKEVGVRKVLGSSRGHLILQVLAEITITVVCAAIAALAIAKLALPYLTHVASIPDGITLFTAEPLLFLLGVIVGVIALSGIYPALVVSGFKPVLALKNKITAATIGGIPLRRSLVVAQFAISQLLIIGTIIAVKQMNFINNADLGFNKNAVLVIPGFADSISLRKMEAFKQQILQIPTVQSATFMSDQPSSDNNRGVNFNFNNLSNDLGFLSFVKVGDADYFKAFGLQFAAGHGYEASDTMRQAVINETLTKKLGVRYPQDAVGKTIRIAAGPWATITGVVKDFKTNSLREEVKPIIIFPDKKVESQIAVKLSTNNISNSVASIRNLWERTYADYAYNGYFLDENINQFYKQENQLALAYKIFAAIAIFISCLGLYGLVAFMTVQRSKEVGIRKVLGATVSSVVYLFVKEFLVLIIISFVIAVPAGWYTMTNWLQNFAYRISINFWTFILAIFTSLIIAGLTVSYKAVKAALANPIRSLKDD